MTYGVIVFSKIIILSFCISSTREDGKSNNEITIAANILNIYRNIKSYPIVVINISSALIVFFCNPSIMNNPKNYEDNKT